jgi:hypothetical protein
MGFSYFLATIDGFEDSKKQFIISSIIKMCGLFVFIISIFEIYRFILK